MRPIFFQLGIITALGCSLLAFEWKSLERELPALSAIPLDAIEEVSIISKHLKKEPPAPKPVPVVVFNAVDDKTDVSFEVIIDAGDNQDKEAPKWMPPLPDDKGDDTADDLFRVVESMPEFPGGYAALLAFLSKHIRYPELARKTNIQGTVHLSFVVSKTGEVHNIELLRGIGGSCDEEAIRVIKMMPAWVPGKQRGKAVNVAFNLPVNFVLR